MDYDQMATGTQSIDDTSPEKSVDLLRIALGLPPASTPPATALPSPAAAVPVSSAPASPPPGLILGPESDEDTLRAFQKFQTFANTQYPGPTDEEISADKRDRLLGLMASALAGGMINRGSSSGGAAGAAAAARGFSGTYQSPTAEKKVLAQQGRQQTAKDLVSLYEHRTKAMQAKAEATKNTPREIQMYEYEKTHPGFLATMQKPEYEKSPKEVQVVEYYNSLPPAQRPAFEEAYAQFFGRPESSSPGALQKDAEYAASVAGDPVKKAIVDNIMQIKYGGRDALLAALAGINLTNQPGKSVYPAPPQPPRPPLTPP